MMILRRRKDIVVVAISNKHIFHVLCFILGTQTGTPIISFNTGGDVNVVGPSAGITFIDDILQFGRWYLVLSDTHGFVFFENIDTKNVFQLEHQSFWILQLKQNLWIAFLLLAGIPKRNCRHLVYVRVGYIGGDVSLSSGLDRKASATI